MFFRKRPDHPYGDRAGALDLHQHAALRKQGRPIDFRFQGKILLTEQDRIVKCNPKIFLLFRIVSLPLIREKSHRAQASVVMQEIVHFPGYLRVLPAVPLSAHPLHRFFLRQ